jgi:hypothetical protein
MKKDENTPDNPAVSRWQPGEAILIQYVFRNQVWYAEPVTVVDDNPERMIVFLQAGTPLKWTWVDFADGTFDGPKDLVWHSTDALKIIEEGARHAVWAMWEAGGGPFRCWYVDLQDKVRRVPRGIITWDRSLDIVVTPDLQWRWKDEDHFQRIQDLGWVTSETVLKPPSCRESLNQQMNHGNLNQGFAVAG